MNAEQFQNLLQKHVVPMFPGSRIEPAPVAVHASKRNATLRDPIHIIVRWPKTKECQCHLIRAQFFAPSDAALIHEVIANLHRTAALFGTPFFDDLINPAIRQTVASMVAPDCADLVSDLLRQMEQWSEETYEGRPISAAIGVDPTTATTGQVTIGEMFQEQFGVVVANGLESFLTVAQDGSLIGYEPFPAENPDGRMFAPLRFTCLAHWARDSRIGLALTRTGEILVLKDGEMLFAKRRGAWRHFTHGSLVKRARLKKSFPRDLTAAIQETCLDVSFARTGGGIGVVRSSRAQKFIAAEIVNEKDMVGSQSVKGRFLKRIIGKKRFYELDRRLRQDLVAVDGSTILDHVGKILAVGAIINIKAGSEGGGRLAAAKTLGKYGLGVKISSDGEIVGYRTIDHKLRLWFAFG